MRAVTRRCARHVRSLAAALLLALATTTPALA